MKGNNPVVDVTRPSPSYDKNNIINNLHVLRMIALSFYTSVYMNFTIECTKGTLRIHKKIVCNILNLCLIFLS